MRRLEQVADQLARLPVIGANAFANGGVGVAAPIVDDRFKGAGNSRFVPLSPEYAARKRGSVKSRRKAARAAGRTFASGSGILTLTGALRAAVTGRQHKIVQINAETAEIIFAGLPDYALYLHNGTPKMPKRSPVEPNAADEKRAAEAMRRELTKLLGTGGKVGTVAFGDGRARVVQ